MSGLAGHMFHLYENPSLTFQEIKKILEEASNGTLLVTEKCDGKNLYVTYNVRNNKARSARTKSDIREGGLDVKSLSEKFEGRGELQSSFAEALSAFEEAVKQIPLEDQMNIFGPNGNYYYNVDILDPDSVQLIKYDNKGMHIHRTGHSRYDTATGIVSDSDLLKEFTLLENCLSKVKLSESTKFKISVDQLKRIRGFKDKNVLNNTINSINQILRSSGTKESDSIAQYLINSLNHKLENEIPDMTLDTKKELIKRLMKAKNVNANSVFKTVNKQTQPHIISKIKTLLEQEKLIMREMISPLENTIHEFASKLLEGYESHLISDNKKEVQRLRDEFKRIQLEVEMSGNQEAKNLFSRHFNKIKDVNNINSAVEGVVFVHEGSLYKLTGNFAPLNQIAGMFKYGRVKSMNKPEQNVIVQENKKDTAIIAFGRFNPPTLGHEVVFKYGNMLSIKDNADFYIIPTKKTDNVKNPLTLEEKINFLNKIFPEYKKNVLNDSNINTIFEMAKHFSQKGYKNLKLVVGSDRVEKFKILNDYNKTGEYTFENIEILSAGERINESESVTGISSTKMRQAAIEGNIDSFLKCVAGRIEVNEAVEMMNLIRSRLTNPEDKKKHLAPISHSILNEFIEKSGNKYCVKSHKKTKSGKNKSFGCYANKHDAHVRLGQIEAFKTKKSVKEMSAVGAAIGSGIEGYAKKEEDVLEQNTFAGPYDPTKTSMGLMSQYGNSAQKRDVEDWMADLYNEEDSEMSLIDRKEFIEELKLRNLIREGIKRKLKEKKQKALTEEQKLRSIIRRLLESEDDIVHSNTGINVLEDVLPKIIKILRTDYSKGQTTPEQRKSYRAHILNAVKNLLSNERVMDSSDTGSEPAETVQEENDGMKVVVKKPKSPIESHPKFIKAEPEKEPEEVDTFTIAGEDLTGRNLARESFKTVGKAVKKGYDILANQKDKDMYYEYLITNLKLYFDKFESELTATPEEPTTPSYEAEKEKAAAPEASAETPPADVNAQPMAAQEPPAPEETGLEKQPQQTA